ncbi:MAG: PPC domain-containing protein [Hyphomonadaceae bacterium]
MMRQMLLAAVAAVTLAACNQQAGSGPALPAPQEGVQAPTVLTPPETPAQRAQIDEQTRTQLISNIGSQLGQIQDTFASGMTVPNGMGDEVVPMEPSTDHRLRFDMTAGTEYRIIGACDGDCTNVDIELVDSRGGVVASDVLPDDYPVVSYTPSENGTYYARLMMRACSVAPCYAGMRVLSAPAQAPAPAVQ